MIKNFIKKPGFTLIELLVVVAIIGLFVSVILVSFGPPKKQTKDAKRQADIKQISLAMDLCYDDADCGAGVNQYPFITTGGANVITAISTYLPSVPTDPVDSPPYQYTWIGNSGDTTEYCVYAKLQATADTWIAASNKGVRMDLTTEPSTIADCW